jgi:glycosyltransferase involved in cell wall biosynthesis
MPISAVIITLNEAQSIGRCIRSLEGVADEIVVIDSYSTDNTVAVAKSLGARIVLHRFDGYGEQKIVAVAAAAHDWVLSIDADEVLSDNLRASLLAVKEQFTHDAYEFNRLTNYCGAWIRHSGWYPEPLSRLWDRRKGHMTADKVHEGWRLSPGSTTGFLKGDLLHYSFPTISAHLKKIEHYSEQGARFDAARGKNAGLLKIWLAPKLEFFKIFILKLGFLDGYYGWIIAKNSAFASFAKYIKLRELRRES